MAFARKKRRSYVPEVRRTAGQSLREQWDRQVHDNLAVIVFAPAMLWMVCLIKWVERWNHTSLTPQFWTGFAIVGTVFALIAYFRLVPHARNLVRGEKGELKVAEALEDMRAAGYRVFHDIRRDGYNIDHVLVGPAGVFVIETKFRSGYGEIEFRNGQGLFVGGKLEEQDSLLQARRNARDVNQILKENCQLNVWANPLVVFVGDWRIRNNWRDTDVRVLTPDQLQRYFANRQPELLRDEIKLIASHLERSAKS